MNDVSPFDEIRPYHDNELGAVLQKLTSSDKIKTLLSIIFPGTPWEQIEHKLASFHTIDEFQQEVIFEALNHILRTSSTGFTHSGVEHLDPSTRYLFISNHRDIVLDPALINYALVQGGRDAAEIAIGDNLLKEDWVRHLVRINKSFVVRRNLSKMDLARFSKLLSSYIQHALSEKRESVWIAQREGRAKDGNDRTQPGLLNMLGMMAPKDQLHEYLMSLNIVPVSISYEFDPCDVDKARQLYIEQGDQVYQKSANEDFLSMQKGMTGHKGRIHIAVAPPINGLTQRIDPGQHRSQIINDWCHALDEQIIEQYHLWPSSYMAYDLLHDSNEYATHYSPEDQANFAAQIASKCEAINGDDAELKRIFYSMYARPLVSKQHTPA